MQKPLVIFIIGVSGVGKSTIGLCLSGELNIPYFDGDDYHSKANIDKMSKGYSLNDDDRYDWLCSLNELARERIKSNGCVIACSALKQKYRELLGKGIETNVNWVLLEGSYDRILTRLKDRKGHYMPESLLESQFDTLEIPEEALKIDMSLSPKEIIDLIKKEIFDKSEFGLIGLGVMGKSLSRNLASNGVNLSLFNRHVPGKEEDVAINFKNEYAELTNALAFDQLESFVNSLQRPRKIFLMVNAGKTVDIVIEHLIPYLSKNDIVIDGGNSFFRDTQKRIEYLKTKRIHFIGAGVSGGVEGALKGPSIMPGGDLNSYKLVKPYLQTIAAKDANGFPCCTHIGKGGSGHFIKMVHNGIEYAEMQLLAEVYFILKSMGQSPDDIADVLERWLPEATSYLLEITINILRKKNENGWVINQILDKAGNKGTGNWTTVEMARLGIPSTMIATALFARYVSSFKEERILMNQLYQHHSNQVEIDVQNLSQAYQLARIVNHYQGFRMIQEASQIYEWGLNLGEIARIWTNGCIIRSKLMEKLNSLFENGENFMTDQAMIDQINSMKPHLNKIVSQCILNEIPIPCFSEAVNFLNGYMQRNSSANMIQAQRDYFGAHTYQKVNDPSGLYYHTAW